VVAATGANACHASANSAKQNSFMAPCVKRRRLLPVCAPPASPPPRPVYHLLRLLVFFTPV